MFWIVAIVVVAVLAAIWSQYDYCGGCKFDTKHWSKYDLAVVNFAKRIFASKK